MSKTTNISEKVYRAMKVSDKRKREALLTELAVALYKKILSFDNTKELANMIKWKFHELLSKKYKPSL